MSLIPERVQVGPHRYQIIADRAAIHGVDAQCNAVTSKDHGRITIDPNRHADAVAETLLHEVLHTCMFANGGYFLDDEHLTQHDFIYLVSPILLDTLRRNPDLVAYLTAEQP